MTVDVADARYRTVHDGRTYYFCSAGCLESFESDPARYATVRCREARPDRLADMLIQNEFTVAAPIDFLWSYLLDVEKIAPCMPGAELTEIVDDHNWKGKLNAKFGPVSMSFAGTVTIESRDDAAHRVVLSAKGMEQKGKGAANAKVTSWLEPGPTDGVTTVKMEADITLTGAAAQLSRGLLPEISKKLTQNVRRLSAGVDGRGADHA